MYRLLRAIGSLLSRYLNRQTLGAYPHPAADLTLMSQILKPADVVLVEGKRRISTAIKYLTQSSWSHAAIYVGGCGGLDAEGRVRAFVEADMEKGVRAFPIEELEGLHLRICRPVGLSSQDARQVATHVLGRLGDRYDLKNVFDLARYLLPTPPVPTPWRRPMLALGSSEPTRAICSTLIAEAFETVGFPILPIAGSKAAAPLGCPDRVREVQHIRHYRLFVPRDFDVSPYFTIIKPSLCRDYRSLAWVDADQPDRDRRAPPRSSIPIAHAKGKQSQGSKVRSRGRENSNLSPPQSRPPGHLMTAPPGALRWLFVAVFWAFSSGPRSALLPLTYARPVDTTTHRFR
jgi:hypothetical protein